MKVNNCDEVCFDDAIQGPPGKDGADGKDGSDGKDGEIKLYDSIGDNTDGAMTQKAVKEALENLVTDIRKTAQSHIPLSYDITDLNTHNILYGWYFVSSVHPSVANAPDGYDGTNYLLELVSGGIGGVQTIQRAWSLSGKPPVYRTSTNGAIWSNWKTFLE